MAGCTSFICPGAGAIWYADPTLVGAGADTGTVCGIPADPLLWNKLPHTQSVSLTPDREDASEIRTDDTGGNKIKVCAGATSWSADVSSVLCTTDWLWCHLFDVSTATTCPSGGGDTPVYLDVSSQKSWYFYFTPNNNYVKPNGNPASPYGGVYLLGFPEVGDFGWDNDDNDPISSDWSIEVTAGPWFQPCIGGDDAFKIDDAWIPS